MKLLKKMITAAIMLITVLSGRGWCVVYPVELPNNPANPALQTPGYIGIVQHGMRIVIPNYNPPNPMPVNHNKFTHIKIILGNGNNAHIYFPVDGRQPTTPEAVKWACANIDNTLTSPITEWYMQMFGWTDRHHIPEIKIGFNENGLPQPIISMHDSMFSMDDSVLSYLCCCKNSHEKKFWKLFRTIASNPVGRILLYRLLIEIRRCINGTGIVEQNQTIIIPSIIIPPNINNELENLRNKYRAIYIKSSGEWAWVPSTSTIQFCDDPDAKIISTVVNADSPRTELRKRDLCIALFHEMLHWYHYLRDIVRASMEVKVPHEKTANPVLVFYFDKDPASTSDRPGFYTLKDPGNAWRNQYNGPLDVRDIRVILGVAENIQGRNGQNIIGFLQGDDLSENLFRCSLSYQRSLIKEPTIPMRYGHTNKDHMGNAVDNSNFGDQIRLAYNVTRHAILPINVNAAGYWPFLKNFAVSP